MRLYTEKGEFTLPEDFALEMQTNNPVFTSEGSASVTFSLPATPENMEAAGRPDRLSRNEAFLNNVECILQLGAFQIQGNLIVTSCNSEEIGCCFTYKEGSLYASYKDKSLKDILKDTTFYPSTFPIHTLAGETQQAMEESQPEWFARFPVKVQLMEGHDIMLNALEDTSDEFGISFGNIIYQARSYSYGDTTINVPDGYGLTAFPFLYHIIEVILKKVGNYNIVRNDFTREPFCYLALLHPVADLMCKGNIAYRDLVPDITLSDFITWLQDKFGAYITVDDKDVSIIILNEILSESPAFDLTPYIDDDLSLEIPDMEHISIDMDTSLAAAPAASMSEFRNKYGTIKEVSDVPTNVAGIYLHTPTGRIYQVVKSGSSYNQVFLGYNNFLFSRKLWASADDAKTTEDRALGCQFFSLYKPSPLLLHLGNAVHYNTAIEGEKEDQDHPLMVAWAYYDGHYWRGSVTGVEKDGTVLFPGLNPEGVFQRFWQKYNTLKLSLAPDASITAHIPADEMKHLDITKPVLIEHNRALIKSYSWTISKDGIVSGKVSLMMLPDIKYPNE